MSPTCSCRSEGWQAQRPSRRGLAPRASSHGILAAPTRAGSEHTEQGTWGDEDLYCKEAGAPVYHFSPAMPCCTVHKWGKVPLAACALCSHPAKMQSHNQCLCPALKEARIRAHNNMAQRQWKGMKDSTSLRGWTIVTEQTVAGLQGLQQQEEHTAAAGAAIPAGAASRNSSSSSSRLVLMQLQQHCCCCCCCCCYYHY